MNTRPYLRSIWTLSTLAVLLTGTRVFAQGIPVIDPAHIAETIIGVGQESITASQTTIGTVQNLYEWQQSFVLAGLKKQIVDSLSDKIVNYAQGGNGGQRFVGNWQDFMNDAGVTGAGGVTAAVADTDVCDSFRTPLLKSLGASSAPSNNPDSRNKLSCDPEFQDGRLNDIQQNPQNGSWEDYVNSTKPQNNYLGAYLLSHEAQSSAAMDAQQAAENEAVAGGGFLSAKNDEGNITTPGSVIQDLTSKAAGADIDLVINAQQLTDVIGNIGNSLISQLTKNDDSGLSGVNLQARRKARNDRRVASGGEFDGLTEFDCRNEFIGENATLEDVNAAKNDPYSDYALYTSCAENAGSENGAKTDKERLLENVNVLMKTYQAAKIALRDTIAKIEVRLANLTAPSGGLLSERNCLATGADGATPSSTGTVKWGIGDRSRPLPPPLGKGSLETSQAWDSNPDGDPSTADGRYRLCLVQGTFSGDQYRVLPRDPLQQNPEVYHEYDDLVNNYNNLVVLRTEAKYSYEKLIDFKARIKKLTNSDPDLCTIDPTDAIFSLCEEFALAEEVISGMSGNTTTATPTILTHPEFNEDRADYVIGRARQEIEQPDN